MSISLCSISEPLEAEEESSNEAANELTRRTFFKSAGALAAMSSLPAVVKAQSTEAPSISASRLQTMNMTFTVNGQTKTLSVDTRTSLLDVLREQMDLTGSKKGCDHGQCGACTVLLDGRRVNACLSLAAAAQGYEIKTIEGLANGDALHPVQTSFLEHDGYQCGYCTPGQILSAVALLSEQHNGQRELSRLSFEGGSRSDSQLNDDEIGERMSGNICRCGAYPNIVAAVRAASQASPLGQKAAV